MWESNDKNYLINSIKDFLKEINIPCLDCESEPYQNKFGEYFRCRFIINEKEKYVVYNLQAFNSPDEVIKVVKESILKYINKS